MSTKHLLNLFADRLRPLPILDLDLVRGCSSCCLAASGTDARVLARRQIMLPALLLTFVSCIYLGYLLLVAAGLYKEPILRHFERYAPGEDAFHLFPSFLLAVGLVSLFGGYLFNAVVAPRYVPFLLALIFFVGAYAAYNNLRFMEQYPQIFLAFPRWYVELRERTTREERRHIAYMWLCLPRSARLHLNGSDHHFQLWADYVILATVTQTVEDQESDAAERAPFSALRDYNY